MTSLDASNYQCRLSPRGDTLRQLGNRLCVRKERKEYKSALSQVVEQDQRIAKICLVIGCVLVGVAVLTLLGVAAGVLGPAMVHTIGFAMLVSVKHCFSPDSLLMITVYATGTFILLGALLAGVWLGKKLQNETLKLTKEEFNEWVHAELVDQLEIMRTQGEQFTKEEKDAAKAIIETHFTEGKKNE